MIAGLMLLNMMYQQQMQSTTPHHKVYRVDDMRYFIVDEEYELGDILQCPICHQEALVTYKEYHSTGDWFFTVNCLNHEHKFVCHKLP